MTFKFNSKIALLIIGVFYLFLLFNESRWKKEDGVIEWDVIGYYGYLPAYFIYHDITLDFMDGYSGPHKFILWPDRTPENKKIIVYSMGLSYLYSPFFFLGHISAHLLGYDTGGYSTPYKFFLQMGGVFFALLGLFFLLKILLKWFSDNITTIVLFLIGFGTNFLHYSTRENGMSHVYNFALIAMFIYYTIRWHEKEKLSTSVLLGILLGIISLIRPTNIIIIFVFLLYGVKSWKDFLARFGFFTKRYQALILMALLCFTIWIPQFLYWHKITGHYLYYSYGVKGESFNFLHSQVLKGLFSYRKGWLLYTPVMIFALIGIFTKSMKTTKFRFSTILFLTLFIYITFSWWCWWYGGSFGSRPMIDIYPLAAIPLAAVLTEFRKINLKPIRIFAFAVVFFFAFKGGYGNIQYRFGAINFHAMTKETYWQGFFKLKHWPGFWEKLCSPDYELAKQGIDKCYYKE